MSRSCPFGELPEADQHLPTGDFRNPSSKAARWEPGEMVPTRVRGVIPDNPTLKSRELQLALRPGMDDAVSQLDPELRKLVSTD